MKNPLVSIIIPTYYRDEPLKWSIESALKQNYENIEVIVVDDSGEKYAREICSEYDVEYIPHRCNKGGNPARNTGFTASQGKYIQFLDDDDVIFQDKIAKQVSLLEDSSVGVVYAGIIDQDGKRKYPDPSQRDSLRCALKLHWPPTITSSLLISASILSDIYPLSNRNAADDIGMKIEMANRTEFGHVDSILTELGDTVGSRSSSIEFPNELQNIYYEYQNLYDQYPKEVEKYAYNYICRLKGHMILVNEGWSISAIRWYFDAVRTNPTNIENYGALLLSLLGIAGIRFGDYIRDLLAEDTTEI